MFLLWEAMLVLRFYLSCPRFENMNAFVQWTPICVNCHVLMLELLLKCRLDLGAALHLKKSITWQIASNMVDLKLLRLACSSGLCLNADDELLFSLVSFFVQLSKCFSYKPSSSGLCIFCLSVCWVVHCYCKFVLFLRTSRSLPLVSVRID